ncbi:MAG: carbohydrate binding domain-containing protein, partial [Planctomycetota bacterium]
MRQGITLTLAILLYCSCNILAATENLVLNGSMEHWHETGIVPQAWGLWRSHDTFYKFKSYRDTKIKKDGRASLRIESKDFVNVYTGYAVKPGKEYTLSAWVRPEKAAKVLVKFSLGYEKEYKKANKTKETPKLLGIHFNLKPGIWQRMHVTGTMPEGVEKATLYFCFPKMENNYNFDMAMLSEGKLTSYSVGENYQYYAPLNRLPNGDEVTYTPKSYGEDDKEVF